MEKISRRTVLKYILGTAAVNVLPGIAHAQTTELKPPPSPTPLPAFRPTTPTDYKPSVCKGVEAEVTWYHEPGKNTATGVPYNEDAPTVAIPTEGNKTKLQEGIGDKIRLTDPGTGVSVELIANDTGRMIRAFDVPRGTGRVLDLLERGRGKFCAEVIERAKK